MRKNDLEETSFDDFLKHAETYPNNWKEWIRDKYYGIFRTWNRTKEIFATHFIKQRLVFPVHSTSRQISIPDQFTWNMDESLAIFLDEAFTKFAESSIAYDPNMTFEEYQDMIYKIRDGFRAYHVYCARKWECSWSLEEELRHRDDALKKLGESLFLLKDAWTGLWW